MFVVNIARKLDPDRDPVLAPTSFEPGSLPDPDRVLAAARGPWRIPVASMQRHADRLVAVDHDYILGVFHIAGVHRDNRLVTFDLQPAAVGQSLIGTPNPIETYGGRTVRTVEWSQIAKPAGMTASSGSLTINGWTLQVTDDGRTAIVSGPASLTITALHGAAARLSVTAAGGDPA